MNVNVGFPFAAVAVRWPADATRSVASSVIAACFVMAGYANAGDADLLALSFDELLKVHVTGATLTDQSLLSVPAAVTVFNRATIARLPVRTLQELMNWAPGYQSYRIGDTSQLRAYSARGRRIGNMGTEVMILIDGQKMADPANGGGAILFPDIPVANIERVEFIRGPSSSIYGANAMMGVINVVTRRGISQAEISLGMNGQKILDGQIATNLGPVSIDAAINLYEDNGERYSVQDSFGPGNVLTRDSKNNRDLYAKLHWGQTHLLLRHSNRSSPDFYVSDTVANGLNNYTAQYSGAALEHQFTLGAVSTVATLGIGKSSVMIAQMLFPPLSSESEFASRADFRLTAQSTLPLAAGNTLAFGGEWSQDSITGDVARFSDGSRLKLVESATRKTFGAYVQDEWSVSPVSSLSMGIRFDHNDYPGVSRFSPRVAYVYSAEGGFSVKTLYGEAFRSPTMPELGFANNPFIKGNAALVPETVKTAELILMQQANAQMWSIGYFANRFVNPIVLDATGAILTYRNGVSNSNSGMEFQLDRPVGDGLSLHVAATHMLSMAEDSFREAKSFGVVGLDWQKDRWSANASLAYVGARETLSAGGLPKSLDSYATFNLKTSFRVSDVVLLGIQLNNLFDRAYTTPVQSGALPSGLVNRGREVTVGLTFDL